MFDTHSYYYSILFYYPLFFSYKEGNKLRLKEKIKDKQEDVIEDEGEHEQTICDQEKVKKETKGVSGVVKVKQKQPAHYQEKLYCIYDFIYDFSTQVIYEVQFNWFKWFNWCNCFIWYLYMTLK